MDRHAGVTILINGKQKGISLSTMAKSAAGALGAWPLPLLPLKLLSRESDRGAGDIIARVIGPIGGDAFKTWYKRLFGKDCGCGARQETLNARWPL